MAPVYKFSNAGFLGRTYKSVLAENDVFVPFSSDFEFITTELVTSTQSSITFNNLDAFDGIYQHLQIRWVAGRGIDDIGNLDLNIGDSTSSTYYRQQLSASGSSLTSVGGNDWKLSNYGGASTNFTVGITDILDVFDANKKPTWRTLSGKATATEPFVQFRSLVRNSNANPTQITISGSGTSLTPGSRFSLYGWKVS